MFVMVNPGGVLVMKQRALHDCMTPGGSWSCRPRGRGMTARLRLPRHAVMQHPCCMTKTAQGVMQSCRAFGGMTKTSQRVM
eukprot:4718935-Amphidinium_carterae.1